MRVLLDESLPKKLGFALLGHEVRTVQYCGWAGLKNGELLRIASHAFDVLITGDKNLKFQQNLDALPIAVIVVSACNNRLESLLPYVPAILTALSAIQPGQLIVVDEYQ